MAVPGNGSYVNVMENRRPQLPSFRKLDVKPGVLRGVVKDIYGRPLQGADLGVRSSLIGGAYSSATAVSDSKGYYEVTIPVGNTEIWGGKYPMDYEGGKAYASLFPADSTLVQFNSVDGAVKNFVLLPYGKGRPEHLSRGPQWPNSYMGGSIDISYNLRTESLPLPGSFPAGTVIVIKLTPLALVDADEKVSFEIRKEVANYGMYINNIPIGRYRIEIRTDDGRPVGIREQINLKSGYGLKPKEAESIAEITFIPGDPETIVWFGNWMPVPLSLDLL